MKRYGLATALGLFIGFQSGTAFPVASLGEVRSASQALQLLQSSGAQGISAADLTALLRGLNAQGAGLSCEAGDGAGVGAGEGEAVAGEGVGEGVVGGEGEGEGEGNEVNINGAFDTPVAVEGGDIKQDILFTKSTVGAFEYEFQNDVADEVTVTENTSPAPPPTGFEALEPNSYKVSLATSKGAGLTLSKIDFIFDTASPELQGKDITQAQVGRFCPDTGAFMISETLGELEFEVEENEVTLNLNKNITAEAEWGIFIPVAGAAAAAPAAEAPAAEAPATEAPAAEAPTTEGEAKAGGEDKAGGEAKAGGKTKANAETNAERDDESDDDNDD